MDDKERELESVRRAEEEARSGTLGRDIGIGGSAFGGASRGNGGAGNGSSMRVQMPVDEDAKEALTGLQQGGLVQLVRLFIQGFIWFKLIFSYRSLISHPRL